jgi:cell division protein FtsB
VANGLLASAGVEFHAGAASITNEALADAQSVLAPSQAAALRQLQAEQQASAQAAQLLRDSLPAEDNFNRLAWKLLLQ